MRCLALAEAWQDAGGTTCLAAAELPSALVSRVSREGVYLNTIHSTPGSSDDALETIAEAKRSKAEWVVVDGDRFQTDFMESLRAVGIRVLLIDDFAARESFPADLVVNPNLGQDGEPYRARGATGLLIGTAYTLMRREFRQKSGTKEVRGVGNRILVTLGGSDPENLTPRIATALAECSDLEITIIAGAAYSQPDELRSLSARNLQVVFNTSNMSKFMKNSDQAIIAAGGTLWELLSTGCAVLSYSRNTVQARVVQTLSRWGVAVDMGETCNFNPAKLVESVEGLVNSHPERERMTSHGRILVDGLGASRVVQAMQQSGAQ